MDFDGLRSGDKDVFYNIVEAYNKLLWVIVGGILNGVGTVEDIEECISDVYVGLWRRPEMFDPEKGSLKTFLAVAARHKALDRYRQLKRVNVVRLDEEISSQDDELYVYVARRELYNELYDAIGLLKEPDKEILIRRYFFDERPAGIADKMTLTVKEVKNRLYQSKLKLKRILQAKEVMEDG